MNEAPKPKKMPFRVAYDTILKKKYFEWIGSREVCDICGGQTWMACITIIGRRLVCDHCMTKPLPPERMTIDDDEDLVHECDDCHHWVGISDMIIDGNRILCPNCVEKPDL